MFVEAPELRLENSGIDHRASTGGWLLSIIKTWASDTSSLPLPSWFLEFWNPAWEREILALVAMRSGPAHFQDRRRQRAGGGRSPPWDRHCAGQLNPPNIPALRWPRANPARTEHHLLFLAPLAGLAQTRGQIQQIGRWGFIDDGTEALTRAAFQNAQIDANPALRAGARHHVGTDYKSVRSKVVLCRTEYRSPALRYYPPNPNRRANGRRPRRNGASAGSTSGVVTVTDNAPTGLTVTGMSGTGWSCIALPSCTRSDILPATQSYPAVVVTVSVAANAPSSLTNMATVFGGGSASATAGDTASIGRATGFAFTWTANPAAGGRVTPASGSLFTAGSSITVTATPNACYAFSGWSGALSGSASPAMLLMNSPEAVIADFTSTAESNVTAQMTTTLSGFRYNRLTGVYLESLTVANNGGALSGPVYVALDSLTTGAILTGAAGTSQCALPTGSPYLLISGSGIGTGQTLTLALQFTGDGGPAFRIHAALSQWERSAISE